MHAQLAEHATDPDRVVTLTSELNAVVAEKDATEMQWMELAEELE
ncbi:Putative ABC transporter, ATP-binding protein [Mycobacteroides abscessus subsp. massiliense]|nr:Putative ABC transporter, ATP-binding protein [Mycobacteroides abscessus subsp. massiliense]